jgi:hypothetical protein
VRANNKLSEQQCEWRLKERQELARKNIPLDQSKINNFSISFKTTIERIERNAEVGEKTRAQCFAMESRGLRIS